MNILLRRFTLALSAACFSCFIVLFAALPLSVHAIATQPSAGAVPISLQPLQQDQVTVVDRGYFVLDSVYNSTLQEYVRLSDISQLPVDLRLAAVDATTGQTSGAVYQPITNHPRDVGSWVHLPMDHLTLQPGQSLVIPFTVNVPRQTWAGQHLGGIVAQTVLPATNAPSTRKNVMMRLNTLARSIVALQVNTPGNQAAQLTTQGMHVDSVSGYQTVNVGLKNAGAQILKPAGSLRIYTLHKQLLQNLPIQLQSFLPHTAIDYPVFMQNKTLPVGDYIAVLQLHYGDANQAQLSYQVPIQVVAQHVQAITGPFSHPVLVPIDTGAPALPWVPILLTVNALLLLSLVGFFLQRSRKQAAREKQEQIQSDGE